MKFLAVASLFILETRIKCWYGGINAYNLPKISVNASRIQFWNPIPPTWWSWKFHLPTARKLAVNKHDHDASHKPYPLHIFPGRAIIPVLKVTNEKEHSFKKIKKGGRRKMSFKRTSSSSSSSLPLTFVADEKLITFCLLI